MKIDICNLQDEIKLDIKFIRNSAKRILQILSEDEAELSLCFTDDLGIQKLNYRYRHINRPTDVLAFPMRGSEGLPKGTNILGDVVISLQTAKSEAKNRKRTLHEEMLLYLVHGILHLSGYNDRSAKEHLKMKRKEIEILGKISKT